MGKSSPSPPPAPDPQKLAAEDARYNRISQITPQGNLTYGKFGPDGTFTQDTEAFPYAAKVTETPFASQIRGMGENIALNLGQNIGQQSSNLQPISFNNLPGIASGPVNSPAVFQAGNPLSASMNFTGMGTRSPYGNSPFAPSMNRPASGGPTGGNPDFSFGREGGPTYNTRGPAEAKAAQSGAKSFAGSGNSQAQPVQGAGDLSGAKSSGQTATSALPGSAYSGGSPAGNAQERYNFSLLDPASQMKELSAGRGASGAAPYFNPSLVETANNWRTGAQGQENILQNVAGFVNTENYAPQVAARNADQLIELGFGDYVQQARAGAAGPQSSTDRVRDALFQQAKRQLDPMFNTQERNMRQSWANRGVPLGFQGGGEFTGANAEAENFNRAKNDAYTAASLSSILAGGQEDSRLRGLNMAEQGQTFNQGVTLAGLQNQARSQGLQEQYGLRNQQLQELATLFGSNFSPQTGQFFSPGNVNVMGANQMAQNAAMNNYNQQMQSNSAAKGGMTGAAGALGAAAMPFILSSREWKEDIKPAAEALPVLSQIPVYTWNYKNVPTYETHVGPMAEDWRKFTGYGDGKTIAVVDMLGLLLKGLQELSDKVAALEARNA